MYRENQNINSGTQIAYQDRGSSVLIINPLGAIEGNMYFFHKITNFYNPRNNHWSWSINLQCGLLAPVEQFCEYKFRDTKNRHEEGLLFASENDCKEAIDLIHKTLIDFQYKKYGTEIQEELFPAFESDQDNVIELHQGTYTGRRYKC